MDDKWISSAGIYVMTVSGVYVCGTCGRAFASKEELMDHIGEESHTPQKSRHIH